MPKTTPETTDQAAVVPAEISAKANVSKPPADTLPESTEPTAEPTSEPTAFSLRDAAQGRGIDPSAYETDESLADAIFTTLEQLYQNEPFVNIGRQFAPYADKLSDFQKWQAEQETAPAEPEPAKATFEWSAPEYDVRWENMVERDERGFYKAPDGIPSLAPIADKMNVYRQFQTDALTKFLGNPQELIHKATADQLAEMERRIVESNQKTIETAIQQQVDDASMNAYVQQQEKDIYQHGADGQIQYDTQGAPMLTPKGHAMSQYATQAEEFGITDVAKIRQFIDMGIQRDELSGRFGKTTPAAQPTPVAQPTPEPSKPATVRKRRFLDRVRSNNRGGTIPDPTAPEGSQQQNPNATMAEITARKAREMGVSLS